MIDIKFGTYFTVELLHKFYNGAHNANGFACPDFNITPSVQTEIILNSYKISSRQNGNQLIAYIRTVIDNSQNPPLTTAFEQPSLQQPLVFFLQCKTPSFLNFTNIQLDACNGRLFYFSNRNSNSSGGKNFISSAVPVYNNSNTYEPGDLASSGTNIYMAIKSSSSQSPFDVSNTDHWMNISSTETYVTENDLLQWVPSVYDWPLGSAQNSVSYQVNGYNTTSKDYSAVIIAQTTINFQSPSSSFLLDLSKLSPGKYDLVINGNHYPIYLNDEVKGTSVINGVIEIYNDNNLPIAYSLTGANNGLTSPTYSISFLNRFTIWEYVLTSIAAAKITDNGPEGYQFTFNAASANEPATITSNSVIPLNQAALNLSIEKADGTMNFKIPSAQTSRLQQIEQNQDSYYCSEIYLNY